MYNILGQKKSEEKKLKEGYFIEIEDVYSETFMKEQSKYFRLLRDLAEHNLLLTKKIKDKNIKSNKIFYRSVINRKDVRTYLNNAYNPKSKEYIILLKLSLIEMNILIGKEAFYALESMVLHKFCNIPSRLSHYKNKKNFILNIE